jgi:hypothetical protein
MELPTNITNNKVDTKIVYKGLSKYEIKLFTNTNVIIIKKFKNDILRGIYWYNKNKIFLAHCYKDEFMVKYNFASKKLTFIEKFYRNKLYLRILYEENTTIEMYYPDKNGNCIDLNLNPALLLNKNWVNIQRFYNKDNLNFFEVNFENGYKFERMYFSGLEETNKIKSIGFVFDKTNQLYRKKESFITLESYHQSNLKKINIPDFNSLLLSLVGIEDLDKVFTNEDIISSFNETNKFQESNQNIIDNNSYKKRKLE